MKISEVKLTTASPADADTGLLGWVSCVLNGTLRLDGLVLRRAADGRHVLSFPARRDGAGHQRFYLKPTDDHARRDFEHQVFQALGIEQVHTRK